MINFAVLHRFQHLIKFTKGDENPIVSTCISIRRRRDSMRIHKINYYETGKITDNILAIVCGNTEFIRTATLFLRNLRRAGIF